MTTASTPPSPSTPPPVSAPGAHPETSPPRDGATGAPAGRVAFLDVARALAMIGVVAMNATSIVFSAEHLGERDQGLVTSALDAGLNLLMSGKARALLMVLLGVGAVLAWRSAARSGGRPMVLMLRRYAALGLLFGLPHLLVFSGDILTHYALTALVLAALMPFLLSGSRTRPFWVALGLFAAAPFLEYAARSVGSAGGLDVLVTLVPQTLGFFCVGVWLARRPELDPARADEPSRLPVRMVGIGLVGQVLGLLALVGSGLLFPMEFDAAGVPVTGPDGLPVTAPGADLLVSLSGTLSGLGGALFFLGAVWWLVGRGRTAARALGGLVPLGRMTLTVYLGSTAVFLLTMNPFEGEIPILAQYGIAAAYFVVMAVFARLWLGAFRLGPLEWVWRSLTHLRPQPLRRARVTPARPVRPERSGERAPGTAEARDTDPAAGSGHTG